MHAPRHSKTGWTCQRLRFFSLHWFPSIEPPSVASCRQHSPQAQRLCLIKGCLTSLLVWYHPQLQCFAYSYNLDPVPISNWSSSRTAASLAGMTKRLPSMTSHSLPTEDLFSVLFFKMEYCSESASYCSFISFMNFPRISTEVKPASTNLTRNAWSRTKVVPWLPQPSRTTVFEHQSASSTYISRIKGWLILVVVAAGSRAVKFLFRTCIRACQLFHGTISLSMLNARTKSFAGAADPDSAASSSSRRNAPVEFEREDEAPRPVRIQSRDTWQILTNANNSS